MESESFPLVAQDNVRIRLLYCLNALSYDNRDINTASNCVKWGFLAFLDVLLAFISPSYSFDSATGGILQIHL
jgi:hypothetical protein